MKRPFASAVVLGALVALLLPASSPAQNPISPGELQPPEPPGPVSEGELDRRLATLSGEVVGPDGSPLPGARVEVRGGGSDRETVTDARGRFGFSLLPSGRYELIASHPNFTTVARPVEVSPGRQSMMTLTLMLAGPVAPGEPAPQPEPDLPSGATSTLFVVEKRLDDDLALQAALNAETESGGELLAVVPLDEGTSLFIYERRPEPAPCTVIVDAGVDGALGADRLQTRIRQQSNKTFIGVHRLGSGVSALVFRDGR